MIKSVLVGWCSSCFVAYDPYPGPGVSCDGGCEEDSSTGRSRILRKRRMYLVDDDSDEPYYLTWEAAQERENIRLGDALYGLRLAAEGETRALEGLAEGRREKQGLVRALKGLMVESRRKVGLHTIACDAANYSFGDSLCLVSCIAARDALRAAGALEEES